MFPIILAAAALPSIMGIQLGAPITLPECVRMRGAMSEHYDPGQSEECFEYYNERPGEAFVFVNMPISKTPSISGFNKYTVALIGGTAQSLSISTLDHNRADYIVAQLSAKFGNPTTDEPDEVVIQHIALTGRRVEWVRPGFTVQYDSINRSLEHGLVLIMTDAAAAADKARRDESRSKATPL